MSWIQGIAHSSMAISAAYCLKMAVGNESSFRAQTRSEWIDGLMAGVQTLSYEMSRLSYGISDLKFLAVVCKS